MAKYNGSLMSDNLTKSFIRYLVVKTSASCTSGLSPTLLCSIKFVPGGILRTTYPSASLDFYHWINSWPAPRTKKWCMLDHVGIPFHVPLHTAGWLYGCFLSQFTLSLHDITRHSYVINEFTQRLPTYQEIVEFVKGSIHLE